jgi:hypothetical protein
LNGSLLFLGLTILSPEAQEHRKGKLKLDSLDLNRFYNEQSKRYGFAGGCVIPSLTTESLACLTAISSK